MPFQLIRQDITKIKVDAIVNPTDSNFSGSGGIDKIVHKAAGINLDNECNRLQRLELSKAVITKAYDLKNCKYIIHTFGPVYRDGNHHESTHLRHCYENCLKLAKDNNLKSIAMPLISTGSFKYPKKEAMKIASDVIGDFVYENEMEVYLLVFDDEAYDISEDLFIDVKNYLRKNGFFESKTDEELYSREYRNAIPSIMEKEDIPNFNNYTEDESFLDCFRRHLIEKKMSEYEVYKGANLSKQAFNGIYNEGKIPKKINAIGLAYGLKLDIDETKDLVEKAGYSFGRTKLDAIVSYYIENEIFDYQKLNSYLAKQGLPTIGSKK